MKTHRKVIHTHEAPHATEQRWTGEEVEPCHLSMASSLFSHLLIYFLLPLTSEAFLPANIYIKNLEEKNYISSCKSFVKSCIVIQSNGVAQVSQTCC